jgi:hypothetical protein
MSQHFVAIPNLAVQDESNLYKNLKRYNLLYIMWAIQKSAQIDDNYYFTIDLLLRFGEQPITKENIQSIKDTLITLENNNFIFNMDSDISPLQSANKNTFLCYSVNWFETHEEHGTNKNWFKLNDSDVINIMTKSTSHRNNQYYLLTTFCNIISRMNSEDDNFSYSYPSLKRIELDIGFSKSRIESYIKALDNINSLHYMNSGDWFKDNNYKTGNNYYCKHYSNWTELLSSVIEENIEHMKANGWEQKSFKNANIKRKNTVNTKIIEDYLLDDEDENIWD